MPPKQRITREMILEESFAMFCREGMDAVNARSVAKVLNCSTQPIFSYYAGMPELKGAIEVKAQEMFEKNLTEALKGENPLEDSCMAYVSFAILQPKLFAHLFMRAGETGISETLSSALRQVVDPVEHASSGLSMEDAHAVTTNMWMFVHGMSALNATGQITLDMDDVREKIAAAHKVFVSMRKS